MREWALLLYNIAWYATRKESVAKGIDLSEMAIKVRTKILGQEDKETLSSMGIAGIAYNLGGR